MLHIKLTKNTVNLRFFILRGYYLWFENNFIRIILLGSKLIANILHRCKFLLWYVWLIIANSFRNLFFSYTPNNCFVHRYEIINPRLPSRMVKQLLLAINKRSVGIYLLLVPRIEALASPYQLNEQRRSPRRYVYKRHKMPDTTYPWASLLLWFLTDSLELPDSDASSTKRQVRFSYI